MRSPGNLVEGRQDEGALPMRKIQADIFPHLTPLLFVQFYIDKNAFRLLKGTRAVPTSGGVTSL